MDFTKITERLTTLGYKVSCFQTAAEAADYLNREIDKTGVGFGGSVTLRQLGLYESLGEHNEVFWHWLAKDKKEAQKQAAAAPVYLSSVNALAETGEIVNIDGAGNRVSAVMSGAEKIYLIAGRNKIAPDYESAMHRARNIAAPQNAKRLKLETPCAKNADRCYDCSHPQRICRCFTVMTQAPLTGSYEIVLVDEELGY